MSTACLVFINAMATEGWDRDGLHDDFSDGLVLHVASRCANTIVVIHTVGIRLVDQWIEHPNVTAVLIAHLPGQDAGEALVSILYGEVSPSGKLPYTVAKNESDYGPWGYEPCMPANKTDRFPQCDYSEGVYIDYRHFDAKGVAPRFEFGFGLSYTTFSYDSPTVSPAAFGLASRQQKPIVGSIAVKVDGGSSSSSSSSSLWDVVTKVSITITNKGIIIGEEIAQLYVGIPHGAPEKQLRGFEKVKLAPGQQARVVFDLTRRDLSVWDVVSQRWVLQRGEYKMYVGASSRDIRWQGTFTV